MDFIYSEVYIWKLAINECDQPSHKRQETLDISRVLTNSVYIIRLNIFSISVFE